MRRSVRVALAIGALLAATGAAQALPKYATKEKKACTYCHVANGNPDLTARGVYYKEHNHSFEGYQEGAPAGTEPGPAKSGPPAFKSAWKLDLPKDVVRVAIANTAPDLKPRLLALDDKNTLTVYNLKTGAPVKEATVDLGDKAKQFVVVHPVGKNKPAVVVVPGAVYTSDGAAFTKNDAPDITDITGAALLASGAENVFAYGGSGTPTTWAIDVGGPKLVVPGEEFVDLSKGAGAYTQVIAHMPPETLTQMGVTEGAAKSGVVGLMDPRKDGKLYLWMPVVADAGTTIAVLPAADALKDPTGTKPTWQSDNLAGSVVDIAYGPDPKGGKAPGILILEGTGESKADRVVEYFALD